MNNDMFLLRGHGNGTVLCKTCTRANSNLEGKARTFLREKGAKTERPRERDRERERATERETERECAGDRERVRERVGERDSERETV